MESESHSCQVCFTSYNTSDHSPRILIDCGHTVCSSCLNDILKAPGSRKCPLDNLAFGRTQSSLDKFPPNFALLALLEGKKQNTCQVHKKKLKIFCFQDKVKICSDCALFGEHKGHPVKKIKKLKAKGIKAKKDLEERLMKFEKDPVEKNQDMETLKKRCLGKMENKFGEINKILKSKHLEWRKQIEDLFEKNNGPFSQKEAEKALEEIDHAIQKEENLAILDRDFSSILSSQQPQEEISKISNEASRMVNCMESFLTNQTRTLQESLDDFDLSNEKIKPEQPVFKERKMPEKLIVTKQKSAHFKSPFSFEIHEDILSISTKSISSIPQRVDLDELNKMNKIRVKLERYEILFQYLHSLSEILEKLNNYTSLMLIFHPSGLTDDRARSLFTILFPNIEKLTEIKICLGNCKITDEPILFLCNNILPKASSLKDLSLKLGFTGITDKSLFALAKSLSPFSKNLKTFRLGVDCTSITDDGIEKIFDVILEVKELFLYLTGTGITDRSLKVLGDYMMMSMKNLNRLNPYRSEVFKSNIDFLRKLSTSGFFSSSIESHFGEAKDT